MKKLILFLALVGGTYAQQGDPVSVDTLRLAQFCRDTSVSANTITCLTGQPFSAYTRGDTVDLLLANSPTAATTININSKGAKAVTYNGTTAMTSGIMTAGGTYRLTYDGTRFVLQGSSGGGGGGSGTVTSVSFTGGLISVATATTTPALTVAGTSGGIPYFSSSSAWASSGVLGANLPLFGGGAGASPIAGTRSGNTTTVVTTTGTQTASDCVSIDANGNHVANGAPCLTSASLGGVYFSLTANGQSVTGVNTTIASSAAEAAFEFTPGAIPSSINVGGVGVFTTGEWYHFDGTNVRFAPCILGSGRTAPSAPSAGVAHFAGSTFCMTSSAVSLTADVSGVLPTANIAVALANQTSLRGNAMAAAAGDATIGQVIAHGSKTLDFASTATGACATVITDTATGAASTDTIIFNANASIKAVTGYVPASTGGFSIAAYPTTNTVNFEGCNWTSGTVDPGSITVNWMVIR